MSKKDFVFAADRHGREDDAEGSIYISAGDEIYAVDNQEDANSIEEHETGFYGNAEDREEVTEYAAGELDERFARLSEEYEEAYLALGNHEDQLLDKNLVKQVAQNYENVHIKESELVEIEGRHFYFDGSFQANRDVEKLYNEDVYAQDAGYEEGDIEAVGEVLDKETEEVTCEDIDKILDGEVEVDSGAESESESGMRDTLENLPFLGKYVFEPLYSLADKYLGVDEEDEKTLNLPDIEKTEQHERIDEALEEYEKMLEQKAETIDEAEGEVTYIAHGQPQTEEMPYASIQTREILERTDNIGAAYVGHFHGGFDGDQEKEIGEVPLINPMEGYTIDHSGGELEEYETHQFEGEPVAQADPLELEQPEPAEQTELSEEDRQIAQQIIMEAREEAEDEEEFQTMVQERMSEEGIQV